MYVVIGVALLVLAVFVGLALKIARTTWFRYLVIIAVVAGVVYLFANGILNLDDVRSWVGSK